MPRCASSVASSTGEAAFHSPSGQVTFSVLVGWPKKGKDRQEHSDPGGPIESPHTTTAQRRVHRMLIITAMLLSY